jgi:hypothetical protein
MPDSADAFLNAALEPITIEFTLRRDSWAELVKLLDAWLVLVGDSEGKQLQNEMQTMLLDLCQILDDPIIEWAGAHD